MATGKVVTNGGSAIGEAIGSLMEEQVHQLFREIIKDYPVRYLTCLGKTKAGKDRKTLLVPDEHGNNYNLDGLVIDASGIPLMLVESKYIRYKKHNRDKASWICNAHSAVRRHFSSIRSSVAVLAGNWSSTSLAMLTSYGVRFFMVPFSEIAAILRDYDVDFEWEENDDEKAMAAWNVFNELGDEEKQCIGERMISVIKDDLAGYVASVLDDTVDRELRKIVIEMHTNKNEVIKFTFDTKEEAMEFLDGFDGEFDISQFKSIDQNR